MVSAAYDMLDRAYRTQKNAVRCAAAPRPAATGTVRAGPGPPPARVLSDTTITVMGSLPEAFALARRAGAQIGEVSSADESAGLIVVMAEFLHAPPCQVTLGVVRRGDDRAHVRCSVEVLSTGEAPPVAAVTRLVAEKMTGAGSEVGASK